METRTNARRAARPFTPAAPAPGRRTRALPGVPGPGTRGKGRPAPGLAELLCPAFLAAYFLLGFGQTWLRFEEPYPFAAWRMYSGVPNLSVTYGLRLNRVAERVLDPPAHFVRAGGMLPRPPTAASTQSIRKFGTALKAGDAGKAERYRALIEGNYLPRDAEYEIVEMRYWPLERWATGRMEESVLRRFATHDAVP